MKILDPTSEDSILEFTNTLARNIKISTFEMLDQISATTGLCPDCLWATIATSTYMDATIHTRKNVNSDEEWLELITQGIVATLCENIQIFRASFVLAVLQGCHPQEIINDLAERSAQSSEDQNPRTAPGGPQTLH